ncbi:MAG TPA: response regulator transcription factor [Phycisphaerales bacterium]|nr:response regulator transcription factor [Phycisphaerales bacterium]
MREKVFKLFPPHPTITIVMSSTELSQADGLIESVLVSKGVPGKHLTAREMQILQSIVAGKTNKQIARMLSRSQRTVEYHRNRLMRKLDAHSPAELVKNAITMGIL